MCWAADEEGREWPQPNSRWSSHLPGPPTGSHWWHRTLMCGNLGNMERGSEPEVKIKAEICFLIQQKCCRLLMCNIRVRLDSDKIQSCGENSVGAVNVGCSSVGRRGVNQVKPVHSQHEMSLKLRLSRWIHELWYSTCRSWLYLFHVPWRSFLWFVSDGLTAIGRVSIGWETWTVNESEGAPASKKPVNQWNISWLFRSVSFQHK